MLKILEAIDFELEKINFIFLKKEQIFITFYNELVFRISLDKAGYGDRFEINCQYDYPLLQKNMLVFPHKDIFMNYGISVGNTKWLLKNKNSLKDYIKEVKLILNEYVIPYYSSIINNFNKKTYIDDEYNRLFKKYLYDIGEESPEDNYVMDFFESGKISDEWNEKDTLICKELTKTKQDNEFPYTQIVSEIIKTIEKNKLQYQENIKKYFKNNYKPMKIDETIIPITIKEFLNKNPQIEKKLNILGFQSNISSYDINIFFINKDVTIKLFLEQGLFLEFEITNKSNYKKINKYNNNSFGFGWLIAKESILYENIEKALEKLEIEILDKWGTL
jgi:hypothetical protein